MSIRPSLPLSLFPQTYVQHLLQKNADSIVRQLLEEGGHFYVCGDISMAADVTRTLQVSHAHSHAHFPRQQWKRACPQ